MALYPNAYPHRFPDGELMRIETHVSPGTSLTSQKPTYCPRRFANKGLLIISTNGPIFMQGAACAWIAETMIGKYTLIVWA